MIAFASECKEEREAARVLGFDAESWTSSQVQQPASTEKFWVEMTDEEKAALKVLGYSASSWDTREPHSSYKRWGDLTDEERGAAEMLGYRAAKWNDREGQAKPPEHIDSAWYDLTLDEQAALEVLGFTEILWDGGTSPRPPSYSKRWIDLDVCGEEISAAQTLHSMQCMNTSRLFMTYFCFNLRICLRLCIYRRK